MFGVIKGLAVTLAQLPKKKVTLQYPEVRPVWPERFRGIHEFIPDLCIACNQCARICPTGCISLSGSRDENKKMRIDTYDINFEICILCDLCTEVCPTEAVLMTDQFELAAYSRDVLYKDMEWLYENHVKHGTYEKLQAAKRQEAIEAEHKMAEAAKAEKDAAPIAERSASAQATASQVASAAEPQSESGVSTPAPTSTATAQTSTATAQTATAAPTSPVAEPPESAAATPADKGGDAS